MIREVYENRHNDGGVPELVTYFECSDCGKDLMYGDAHFVGDTKNGKECYCDEHALDNGWVKCDKCGDIIEDRHTEVYMTEDKREITVCHACLEILEDNEDDGSWVDDPEMGCR